MRLPAGLRRRHDPAARLPVRQLGDRLRRPQRGGRPPDGAAPALAARERAGALRPTDHGRRTGRGVAPSHPARQIERAAAHGLEVKCATELEFYLFRESFAEAAGQAVARAGPPRRLHRGLPAAADVAGGVRHRAHPQPDARSRDPDRVLQGRGRHRPARDQHHLRRRPRGRRPSSGVQERGEGDRRGTRPIGDLHGQMVDGQCRVVLPHPHQPVGRGDRRADDGARATASPLASGLSVVGRAVPGRADPRRPAAGMVLRPLRQLLPALRSRFVGPDRRGLGRGQPDLRIPRRSERAPVGGWRAASRGPT